MGHIKIHLLNYIPYFFHFLQRRVLRFEPPSFPVGEKRREPDRASGGEELADEQRQDERRLIVRAERQVVADDEAPRTVNAEALTMSTARMSRDMG